MPDILKPQNIVLDHKDVAKGDTFYHPQTGQKFVVEKVRRVRLYNVWWYLMLRFLNRRLPRKWQRKYWPARPDTDTTIATIKRIENDGR